MELSKSASSFVSEVRVRQDRIILGGCKGLRDRVRPAHCDWICVGCRPSRRHTSFLQRKVCQPAGGHRIPFYLESSMQKLDTTNKLALLTLGLTWF